MAYTGAWRETRPSTKTAWSHPYCRGIPTQAIDLIELRQRGKKQMLQMAFLSGLSTYLFHNRFIPIPKKGIIRLQPFAISRALTVPLMIVTGVTMIVENSLTARQTVCSYLEDALDRRAKLRADREQRAIDGYKGLPTSDEVDAYEQQLMARLNERKRVKDAERYRKDERKTLPFTVEEYADAAKAMGVPNRKASLSASKTPAAPEKKK